jgi:heme-degrading monooxygenase HmoA
MISRIVQCTFKNNRLDEARQTFASDVIPQLRKQPGFIDVIEWLDPNTGRFVCTSLWRTRDFLEEEPTVDTLQVETSTVHNIMKGKQAAA